MSYNDQIRLDSLHSDTVCITPDCLVTGGGGEEWWVQGDIYWLPDRADTESEDSGQCTGDEADNWLHYSTLPWSYILHTAVTGLNALLDIALWKQNHFPEMSLSGASEREKEAAWNLTMLYAEILR